MSYSVYESFKKYAVTDVATVQQFLDRYYRHDRYKGCGDEYARSLLASHQENFDSGGFDFISHHDSNTGGIVAFYAPIQRCKVKEIGATFGADESEYSQPSLF